MTRYKWLNYLIRRRLDSLFIAAGVGGIILYALGILIPNATMADWGLGIVAGVLMLVFIHANLHSLDRELVLLQHLDRIPYRRIRILNRVMMTAFCLGTLAVMLVLPRLGIERLLSQIGMYLLKILRFIFSHLGSAKESEAVIEAVEASPPALSDLPAGEPSLLAELFEMIMYAVTVIILVLLALAAIRYLARRLLTLLQWRITDGDQVRFLDVTERTQKRQRKPAGKRRLFEIFDRSPEALVRRLYRRIILDKKKADTSLSAAMTPAEIQKAVGIEKESLKLRDIYEKARYGGQICSREDYEEIKRIKEKLHGT